MKIEEIERWGGGGNKIFNNICMLIKDRNTNNI